MNSTETVVAVIEPQTASGEDRLANEVTDIESRAEGMVVTDDRQYTEAGEFGVLLKQKMAEVTAFFAPMKKAAHDAHKQVCDREKQMLKPLKEAEGILKRSMGAYVLKKEKERQEVEQAARWIAKEAVDKKLEEAVAAEATGNQAALSDALMDATIADNASRMVSVESSIPQAKGVSYKKDWQITNIDTNRVPDSIFGVIIRPVDTADVMRLILSSNVTVQIDGVDYCETANVTFRRS